MPKKQTDNLPALTGDQLPQLFGGLTFVRQANEAYTVSDEVLAELDEDDEQGYDSIGGGLPFKIVTIRGKDLEDENGEVLRPAGGFQLSYDPTTPDKMDQPPDVPRKEGMLVNVLASKYSRVFWPKFGDPIACRSLNYTHGTGDPGGICDGCKWNSFSKNFEGTDQHKCKTQVNLFCFDHVGRLPFVLRLGPGSLKVWEAEMKRLVEERTPKMTVLYKVTTRKTTSEESKGKTPWWIPILTPVYNVSLPIFRELKEFKKLTPELDATMEVMTDQDGNVEKGFGNVPVGEELPEGVDAVQTGPIPGHGQVAKDGGGQALDKDGKELF